MKARLARLARLAAIIKEKAAPPKLMFALEGRYTFLQQLTRDPTKPECCLWDEPESREKYPDDHMVDDIGYTHERCPFGTPGRPWPGLASGLDREGIKNKGDCPTCEHFKVYTEE